MNRGRYRARQRGAAVVMTAGFMMLAALCLALVVDTGRLYLEKRKLQRVADMSALEAAGRQGCVPGHSATALAAQAAERNGFAVREGSTLTVTCGFLELLNGERRFVADAGESQAIRVVAARDVPASLIAGGLMGGSVRLAATAVALRMEPVAVFKVGSKLLNTNGAAPLMSLLKLVGLNLDGTTVASYDGLAGVKITPAGLLKALGLPVSADIEVGDLNRLLAINQVSLGDILDATVKLAGQDQLLGVNLTLLTAIKAGLGIDDLKIQLGTDPAVNGLRGLFANIEAASGIGGSALDVGVNALDLITAAIGIGTSQNGVALDVGTAGVSGLNILTGLQVSARVVEPQSIGIGGVGTRAYNAQVRLFVDLNTAQGITGILQLLGTVIRLPVIVDAVNAEGTITRIDCDASPRTVTIEVKTSVANACVGHVPQSVLWSKSEVCTDDVRDATMVRLLGLTLLHGHVSLSALHQTETMTLKVGETRATGVNNLAVGTLLTELVDEVLDLLGRSEAVKSPLSAEQAASIADGYLNLSALAPTGTGGNYRSSDLDKLQNRLSTDGVDWQRPVLLLFSQNMLVEWRNSVNTGCNVAWTTQYTASCVREKLIASLQTDAKQGWLDQLLGGLVGGVVQPLLSVILKPLVALLEGLLNDVGKLLSSLLANVLGLELGRADVTLDSLSCGSAKLVI